MNSREIKDIDINEIMEEHISLGIYEENSKKSSALTTIINMTKFSFWKSCNIIRYQQLEALKSLYRSPGYKKNQLVLCKNCSAVVVILEFRST